MIQEDPDSAKTLYRETLKYYESHIYNPQIAEVILEYKNSARTAENENKVIGAFEYLAMKEIYASACMYRQAGLESMPSTLKIMDLLLCIEEIALNNFRKLEEYTSKYLLSLKKLDDDIHESKLDKFEALFESIADCVSRLCTVYKGWHHSHLPLILLRYMMYHSRSVLFDLKVHHLMRNILFQVGIEDELGTVVNVVAQGGKTPLLLAIDSFKKYTAFGRVLILTCQHNATKCIERVSEARDAMNLKEFQAEIFALFIVLPHAQTYYNYINDFFDIMSDKETHKKNFKLTCSWLWDKVIAVKRFDEDYIETGIYEIIGIFKFMQLVLNQEISPEAIMSLLYNQRVSLGVFEFPNLDTVENLLWLAAIKNVCVAEMKRAIYNSKVPRKILSTDFAMIIDGFVAISRMTTCYLVLSLRPDAQQFNFNDSAKLYLDNMLSTVPNQLITLLENMRQNHAEIKKTKANSNSPFNSPESVYYKQIFSILRLIDECQMTKYTILNSGFSNHLIAQYVFVNPEILGFLKEEKFSALNSELESFGMVYWSQLTHYERKWRTTMQDLQGFYKAAIESFQIIVERILSLEKSSSTALKKIVPTYEYQNKYALLNIYSLIVTNVIVIREANESAEIELKEKFAKSLQLDKVIKFFDGLRARVSSKSDKLTYEITCYYYCLYFGVCSYIQGFRLQKGNEDLIMTTQQFKKLLELAVSFSLPNLQFPDLLLQLPAQITKIRANRPEYLNALHSSGFVEYLCKEVFFEFSRQDLVHIENAPYISNNYRREFGVFKLNLYDQLIENKNYQQTNKIISICKEKLIVGEKLLKSRLLKFQEIHNFQKYCCVSEFWLYYLNVKLFIQALDDLFERSKTKGFEKEPDAAALMKTLQESLISVVEICISLPLVSRDQAIGKYLINLLGYTDCEVQIKCPKVIRAFVLSCLNTENHRLIVTRYEAILQTSSNSPKEFKLSDFIINLNTTEAKTPYKNLLSYLELDNLASLFDTIDFKAAQKLTSKIKDSNLLAEDFKALKKLWSSFYIDMSLIENPGNNIHKITNKLLQHYFTFFNLCYDNAAEMLVNILLENLNDLLKRSKDPKLRKFNLKDISESLFTVTALMLNFIHYYLLQPGAITKELAVTIQSFLSKKGFLTSVMEAIRSLEEINALLFKQITNQENKSLEKVVRMTLVLIRFAKKELKSFFNTFVDKQILRDANICKLFVDSDEPSQLAKSIVVFFQELLEGSVHLVQLNPEAQDFASEKDLAEEHQQLIDSALRFEKEVINLMFFSSIGNPAKEEMIDFFSQNAFVPLLKFSKSVPGSAARETCTILAKFSTLKQEALYFIFDEIERYKKAFSVLATMDALPLKYMVESEIKISLESKTPDAKTNFTGIISALVRSYNEVVGILNSNMEALVDQSSSLVETNIAICNKLFECLQGISAEELQDLFTKRLSQSDYQSFCRFSLEVVRDSSSIFQKICKNDEPLKMKKTLNEFYLLCVSLLKPGKKLEIFSLNNTDDQALVLLNLFAIFEHSPEIIELFLTENPEIVTWIVQEAENSERGYWLFYLLTKALALDCDVRNMMLMYTVSQGIMKIDTTTYSGDFNNNFFNFFYHELFESVQKEILKPDGNRLSLSLSSKALKDLPYIDPEKLTLSKSSDSLFRSFIRAIELSSGRPQQIKGFITILAYLIPLHPHLVILLSKTSFHHFSPSVSKSSLAFHLRKSALTGKNKEKEQSFLNCLLQTCLDNKEDPLLFILINALIEPQLENQLILYNDEIIPTVTYSRQLVAKWLIKNFDDLAQMNQVSSEETINSIVSATKILFREVHLLSRREIELYYQVCSKCFNLFQVYVKLTDPQQITRFNSIISCLDIYKQLHYTKITAEYFDQSYPDLLFNYNTMVATAVREYLYKQQTSQAILQFTNKPDGDTLFSEQSLTLNTDSRLISISKDPNMEKPDDPNMEKPDYLMKIYGLSKVPFVAKLTRSHLFSSLDAIKINLPTFEKETRFILSKLPSNNISLCDTKLNTTSEEKDLIYGKLMEQIQAYDGPQAKILKTKTLATDLKFEDFLTETNPQEELVELARIVKAKFRKNFEPILHQKFEGNLLNRRIHSSFKTSDLEKELMEFLNNLSRKEYIAFLLFADAEVFNRQPKHIQAILLDLKEKARDLLSDKAFYPETKGSAQTIMLDSKISGGKTRLERLITLDSKSQNSALFDELESLLLGRIDCNVVRSQWKNEDNSPNTRLQEFDGERKSKFYSVVYNILDQYMENKKTNLVKRPRSNNFVPFPGDMIEKLTLALLVMYPNIDLVTDCVIDTLMEAVDLLRWLDLMLVILAFPDSYFADLNDILKAHFNIDPEMNLSFSFEFIKDCINKSLSSILVSRMIEPVCLGSFKVFISKIESELGVLPLKRKLLEVSQIKYEEDQTFIQLWVSSFSTHNNAIVYVGSVLFVSLVELVQHLDSNNPNVEEVIKEHLTLLDNPKYFHFGTCRLSGIDMFVAVKNPKVFELLLESCSSAENTRRLIELDAISATIHVFLKTNIYEAFSTKFSMVKLETHENICEYMGVMYSTLVRFILEATERLSNLALYTNAERSNLSNFNKLLKEFVTDPILMEILSLTAGNLEIIEQKIDATPDSPTIEFINSCCSYIFLFYRLSQAQEELEYVLSFGQEPDSLALLRIKSKAVSVHPENESQLSLDKSLSTIYLERPLSPDEIMFRLSSKCNKVFKAYVNMERESYNAMSMVPWVIPLSIRLEFIREKLAKSDSYIVKNFYLRRQTIIEDTIFNFDSLSSTNINSDLKLNIGFVGEGGIDGGGLTTEWASEVLKILLDPSYGLFHLSSNKISLQPSPTSAIIPSSHKYYKLVGRILGYVIANGISASANFTRPMIKQLLGVPLTPLDLNDVDPELSHSLQWMLENKINSEELLQKFSFEFCFLDSFYTINLSKELANQLVDEDNKKLFVKHVIYHKLGKSIEAPLAEIKAGITEFVPAALLKLFTPADLHSLLAGESTIDIEEMKKYAKLEEVPPNQEVVNWLWEILQELEKDELSSFMFFITGNSRVGFGGFKEHPIRLYKSFQSSGSLPTSHTCVSGIEIPDYPSKAVMKEKLLKAIREGQGYQMA